jgi:hypothetical protein
MVSLSTLRAGRTLLRKNICWYSFLLEDKLIQGLVQLEGLGQLKKLNDLNGIRTRDFLACSILPQKTSVFLLDCKLYFHLHVRCLFVHIIICST